MVRARYSREGLRRAELVRQFLRLHVRHTKGPKAGQPLELEDWQWEDIVLPIYGTLNREGRRKYTKALIGLGRWNGKSVIAQGLSHYHLAGEPVFGGEQYAVATTLAQAGIVFGGARRQAFADPLLSRLYEIKRSLIEVRETGAVFKAIPHNADTAQGFHPNFAAIDELHVHANDAMVNAMISGSIGYPEPLIVGITTAGPERRGVWWDLLKAWRKDPGAYVYWAGATDADDPHDQGTWRKANPASWITDQMLERQYRTLRLADFMRYHLNLAPKKGANKVFTESMWRACSAAPVIDPERPTYVGVDASLRRDHTAVVLDQVDGEGVHNVLCFTFRPEDDGSIMGAIDHDQVGMLLRELAATHNVRRVPCDRAYFVRTMRELLEEGLPVEEFAQTNQNMARACQRLYDVVSEGRMRHGGDAALEDHVLNAAVKETPFGWRITKPAEGEKVDAAIALAMALDTAEADRPGPSFAETGGIWSLPLG